MKKYAVIGAGFGDEGKGLVTNFLCGKYCGEGINSAVVRFSGGVQAGHRVELKDGDNHVFKHFGSGSFSGVQTYWSRHCPVETFQLVEELWLLRSMGYYPQIVIDKKCPITTPYDAFYNQGNKTDLLNGTCGFGVGATIKRELDGYSLLFEDLFNRTVFDIKLGLIKSYYKDIFVADGSVDGFIRCCDLIMNDISIFARTIDSQLQSRSSVIFEGSQGMLLDQDNGFFPHVTRSSTGSKNIAKYNPEIFLVTRAYQTRHGNGPMTNEHLSHDIKLSSHEQNVKHEFQGDFRISVLDLNLLKYAINKDDYIRENKKNLVITCLDNIKSPYKFTIDSVEYKNKTEVEFVKAIKDYLQIDEIYLSHSPVSSNIVAFN